MAMVIDMGTGEVLHRDDQPEMGRPTEPVVDHGLHMEQPALQTWDQVITSERGSLPPELAHRDIDEFLNEIEPR